MNQKRKFYKGKIFDFDKYDSWRWKIKNIFPSIRRFFQRGRNGYCHVDVWDIDAWFLTTIPHMLDDLIENGISYPGRDEADTPEKWAEILKYMKYCFEEACEDTCSRQNPYDIFTQKKLYLEEDKKLSEYRDKMKKEGLELFVKWFDDLWD